MSTKTLTIEVTEPELAMVQAGLEILRLKLTEEDGDKTGLYKLCKKLWAVRPPAKEVLRSLAANPEESP